VEDIEVNFANVAFNNYVPKNQGETSIKGESLPSKIHKLNIGQDVQCNTRVMRVPYSDESMLLPEGLCSKCGLKTLTLCHDVKMIDCDFYSKKIICNLIKKKKLILR